MCKNKFKKEKKKKFNVSLSSFVTDAFIIIFTNPLPNEGYEDLPLLRTELWTPHISICLMSKPHYFKMWLFLVTGPEAQQRSYS